MRGTSLFALGLLCSGCFAVTDLDRFTTDGEGGGGTDLVLVVADTASIMNDRIEFRVVNISDPSQNTIEVRGILEGVAPNETERVTIVLEDALDGMSVYRVQLFADRNEDGIVDMAEPSFTGNVVAGADGRPTATISAGGAEMVFDEAPRMVGDQDVVVRFRGMSVHVEDQQLLELLVTDIAAGRAVGYYRVPDIDDVDFDVEIGAVVVDGRSYELQFYADTDGTGAYEPGVTSSDHSWIRTYAADGSGIDEVFDHTGVFEELTAFP